MAIGWNPSLESEGQENWNQYYLQELQKAQLAAAKKASGSGMGAVLQTDNKKKAPAAGVNQAGYYSGPGGYVPSTNVLPPNPNVVSQTGGAMQGGTQTTAEQERYDPWSKYRDQFAGQLGGTDPFSSPSSVYQNKLAQMVQGQFSPDDPSYKWRFDQGQQAVERSLAARGLLNSGNAAIELQQYGQGAASQEYGNQFNRLMQGMAGVEDVYNTQMGRLMKMAGVDIDPTAGGRLNVAQGGLAVDQGRLGLAGQEVANQYDIERRKLDLAAQAQASGNYNAGMFQPFGAPMGASPNYQPVSWDAYFAAKDAAGAAADQAGNFIGFDSGGSALFRE